MSAILYLVRLKVSVFSLILIIFQYGYSQERFQRADSWINDHLVDLGGRAVLIILKDSQVVYRNSYNDMSKKQVALARMKAKLKDEDKDAFLQDFTLDTRERIASASKWLTAALAMTFIDENKFRLGDTVGKFLPILSKNGKGHIKIWHCLSNTTAIKDGGIKETISTFQKIESNDAYLELICSYPMEGEPGKVFRYGNTGMQILAAIMEKVGGKDFETLFKERIADPLEMKQTDFGKKPFTLAASGAFSTPNDYIKFLQMILNEGLYKERRIISKALINEMQKNKIGKDCILSYSPDEAGRWGYGLGVWLMDQPLAVTPRKDAMPESARSMQVGCPGLMGSFPWINHQKKYAALLFVTNLSPKWGYTSNQELKDIVDADF